MLVPSPRSRRPAGYRVIFDLGRRPQAQGVCNGIVELPARRETEGEPVAVKNER